MRKFKLFLLAFALLFVVIVKVDATEVTDEATLESCLNTANSTCLLKNDVELSKPVTLNVKSTLDLNGKTIKPKTGFANKNWGLLGVRYGGDLTVKDSVGGGKISIKDSGVNVYAGIIVTVKDDVGTDPAVLTIESGTIEGFYYGIAGNGSRPNTKITVNGGTISCLGDANEGPLGIFHPQTGDLVVNGGTIEGFTGIEMRAGNLTVNGGTITGKYNDFSVVSNGSGSTTNGAGIAVSQHGTKLPISVTIKGGTISGFRAFNESTPEGADAIDKITLSIEGGVFNSINGGTVAVNSDNKTGFISGGTFNTSVNETYIKQNHIAVEEDSKYVVKENKVLDGEKVSFENTEAMPTNYVLDVEELDDTEKAELNTKVENKFKSDKKIKDTKLISVYDINVKNGVDIVPMEDGNFKISIEIPESDRKYDTYKVLYIKNGEINETIDAELVDGKVVFTTSHLSVYGIVGYNNVSEKNPNTVDSITLFAIFCLIGFAVSVVSFKKLKHNA